MAFANGESGYYPPGWIGVTPQEQADRAPNLRALAALGAQGWSIDSSDFPFSRRTLRSGRRMSVLTGQESNKCQKIKSVEISLSSFSMKQRRRQVSLMRES